MNNEIKHCVSEIEEHSHILRKTFEVFSSLDVATLKSKLARRILAEYANKLSPLVNVYLSKLSEFLSSLKAGEPNMMLLPEIRQHAEEIGRVRIDQGFEHINHAESRQLVQDVSILMVASNRELLLEIEALQSLIENERKDVAAEVTVSETDMSEVHPG